MSEDTTLAGTPSPQAADSDAAPKPAIPVPTAEGESPSVSTSSSDIGDDSSPVGEDLPPASESEFRASDIFKVGVAQALRSHTAALDVLSSLRGRCSNEMVHTLEKAATRHTFNMICSLHEADMAEGAPTPPTE